MYAKQHDAVWCKPPKRKLECISLWSVYSYILSNIQSDVKSERNFLFFVVFCSFSIFDVANSTAYSHHSGCMAALYTLQGEIHSDVLSIIVNTCAIRTRSTFADSMKGKFGYMSLSAEQGCKICPIVRSAIHGSHRKRISEKIAINRSFRLFGGHFDQIFKTDEHRKKKEKKSLWKIWKIEEIFWKWWRKEKIPDRVERSAEWHFLHPWCRVSSSSVKALMCIPKLMARMLFLNWARYFYHQLQNVVH